MNKKLVVFDLDFTLWDAGGTWCDHTTPPYSRQNAYFMDAEERIIRLYPDVLSILEQLHYKDYVLAVASRTQSPSIAKRLMELFDIQKYFTFQEIYPGSKTQHFGQLQGSSKLAYHDMFFFDDEQRNINEVAELGVNVTLVHQGLRWEDVEKFQIL